MNDVITLKSISLVKTPEDLIGTVCNRRVRGKKYFVARKNIKIKLNSGDIITIPKSFDFDGSTVPLWLTWIFPRYGPFLFAAMIHDWLYVIDYKRKTLGSKEAQKLADKEMLLWSDATNYYSNWALVDNWLRYLAVRLFGRKKYEQ